MKKAKVGRPRLKKLNKTILKELRSVQRVWRKSDLKIPLEERGRIKASRVRKSIKSVGWKETKRLLEEAKRYAKGLAYTENIKTTLQRLETFRDKFQTGSSEHTAINRLINQIKRKGYNITEDEITKMVESFYNYNEHKDLNTLLSNIRQTLNLKE